MNPNRLFTLGSVLTRVNKTLSLAEQIIPLYVKAKPMVNNAKDAFKVIENLATNYKKNEKEKRKEVKQDVIVSKDTKPKLSNGPTFFL